MRTGFAVVLALLAAAGPAAAQDACAPLVGTYLTQKVFQPGTDPDTVGRSLIALIGGGVAAWTDSNQGGGEGWQAFTEARGGWTCEGNRFTALVLDFTHPSPELPAQQVARIDVAGTVEGGRMEGNATILFYPLGGDPSDTAAGTNAIRFEFTGTKVTP
jgi:hypothetical protein